MPLGGSLMANRLWVMGQTMSGLDTFIGTIRTRYVILPGRVEHARGLDLSASAWWPGYSSRDPAGPSPNETRGHPPEGPPLAWGTMRDRCKEDWAVGEGGDLNDLISRCLKWL
ncbi:hypothetical protein ILYODFUR_000419 [Ilyodon furcidens]|uniref:Uncharacterized protein n=1 Tax=Ilyodon furcidens TaxID=33524 RepID=A0ABV0UCZ3_9TELE